MGAITNAPQILVVDDSEMNRSILIDMLGDKYRIIEAENGAEAVPVLRSRNDEIFLVLLDFIMPRMNGLEVLEIMNQHGWIENTPVIMISSENMPSYIEQAYRLGVTDFITRPFDSLMVQHRVINTIMLYTKQKKLADLVAEQIYEKEKRSNMMVDILGHIVEFRNKESGAHILNIRRLTELLLKCLILKDQKYSYLKDNISLISAASALHDIGKITIPAEILNKPGRLTPEEFEVMKTHSAMGAKMLKQIPVYQEEPLLKAAYEICRWHHERYDGKGYPDGLVGDEIPISAQVVALADVYDALTGERVYKQAIPHEKAVKMILNGECGAFQPLLLQCLEENEEALLRVIGQVPTTGESVKRRDLTQKILNNTELFVSDRTLRLLEHERMKYRFYASMTEEIQFEYILSPSMLSICSWGAEKLGLDEIIMEPEKNGDFLALFIPISWEQFCKQCEKVTREQPVIQRDMVLNIHGKRRWYRVICQAYWADDENEQPRGFIGKAWDIHVERSRIRSLEYQASHDGLTGLLNGSNAKQEIMKRIERMGKGNMALAILDVDYFKDINDSRGHMFGDKVLKHVAEGLRSSVRERDLIARVGGDEFLLFFEYTNAGIEAAVERVFQTVTGDYDGYPISVSIGAAKVENGKADYAILFQEADQALYEAKRRGRGQWCFYDDSMSGTLSMLSPIESDKEGDK